MIAKRVSQSSTVRCWLGPVLRFTASSMPVIVVWLCPLMAPSRMCKPRVTLCLYQAEVKLFQLKLKATDVAVFKINKSRSHHIYSFTIFVKISARWKKIIYRATLSQ